MAKRTRKDWRGKPVYDSTRARGQAIANGCLLIQIIVFICGLVFGLIIIL